MDNFQKYLSTEILRKFEAIPVIMYNKRFIIAILCAAILLFTGCKKFIENVTANQYQQYFEQNILTRTFIVDLAKDSSVDKTSVYAGYNFVLTKGSSLTGGPITGTKDGTTYSGTWECNADYSKLEINFTTPAIPVEFSFINRAWRFTKKALPVMELAPYTGNDPKILNMRRL